MPKRGKPKSRAPVKVVFVMNEFTDDVVAITGHRVYPDRAAIFRGLDRLHAREYLFGGARGVDSDALEYISRTQPHSVRTVVVPNRVVDQPRSSQVVIRRNATRVIELRNTGADRYMIRNRYMVDHSRRTTAFYDFRGRGGTYNTIQYARSKGKLDVVNPLREFNFDEFRSMSRERFGNWVKEMKGLRVNLSSIKMIIVEMILYVFKMTVEAFISSIGYVGVKSLEKLWLL